MIAETHCVRLFEETTSTFSRIKANIYCFFVTNYISRRTEELFAHLFHETEMDNHIQKVQTDFCTLFILQKYNYL